MTSDHDRPTRRYPLHVTIAFVFSALLLIVGIALISYNYHESRKMAMLGADRLLARTSSHLETTVSDLYGPVRSLVDISSRVLSSADTTLEDRLSSLPFLAEPLRRRPHISAVFVGYEDGDLFLVRGVDENWQSRRDIQLPAGARFLVQSIDHGDAELASEEWLFYDTDLVLLDRLDMGTTDFDTRHRTWYKEAMTAATAITTNFYVFYTTRETGLTVARQLAGGGAAVGADLALRDLGAALAHQRMTPSSRIAVLDPKGGVIALSEMRNEIPLVVDDANARIEMPHIGELDEPVYTHLGGRFSAGDPTGREVVNISNRDWLLSISTISANPDRDVFLAVLVPQDELLATINQVRNNGTLISLSLLVGAVLLVVGVSRNISRSLGSLAQEAELVREFRFDTPITVRSRVREVNDLAETMALMKSSIQQFLEISQALSAEKDFYRILEMVLKEAIKVSQAGGGAVLMMAEDHQSLEVALMADSATGTFQDGASGDTTLFEPIALDSAAVPLTPPSVDYQSARQGLMVRIDDLRQDATLDTSAVQVRHDTESFQTRSLLSVPLQNQADEVIGVLQLVSRRPGGFRPEIVPYIEALSSDAAVALDIRRLLKAQRELLDSLIRMIAGAIDAKSPYTHGHCQRVPVAARMLAEAAHQEDDGLFADFSLNENEWYELHLASWLHDCGKLTTPDYVVDKATKLETIYNRIHEIRTRFEVLWRDAEIDYFKDLAEEPVDERNLQERLEKRQAQIREDFEFIAGCNLGEEFMSDADMERVKKIASSVWVRHLDDSLGLSHGELLLRSEESSPLPVKEPLLNDKPDHVIPRPAGQNPFGDDAHGFRMEVPEFQYNRGEVHNLCVSRGTLTSEERFKINEHVIQTIRMLRQLPFPRELRRVPDWAGNHHEKMDGTGYPRRLSASDLSIPERIMAIADIFEALTARDRPYSSPRSMSQALRIMGSMCAQGHLCPDLFGLFLTSGVYREYGKEHLDPEQLDEVDIASVIAAARG